MSPDSDPPGRAAALEAANIEFYESFEALDLDRMEAVWAHTDDVYCVHPGSTILVGWAAVRRSWAAIFASASYLQFIVTDVVARVDGPARPAPEDRGHVGRVTCHEHVLAGGESPMELGGGLAVASNIFVWAGGRWLMVAHHASPVIRTLP